jgi:hypothetical protein
MHLRSVAALLGVCAFPLLAQLGNGGNGDLDITPLAIGSTVTLTITGGANQPFLVYSSPNTASIPTPYGVVSIDVTSPFFGLLLSGTLSPAGTASASAFIGADPGIFFIQGAVLDPGHPSGVALTRAIRIDFEAADGFAALPSLAAARALGTGDLLKDGRVLVAGGGNGTILAPVATNTTELYEPYFRTWSAGPNLSQLRSLHATAVLNDGRVLFTGGTNTGGVVTATCEIFDPVTNTMGPAASMASVRAGHSATTLSNGKVLVTGGVTVLTGTAIAPILNSSLNTGEVYDPVANTWTPVGNTMASKRFLHTQTRLQNGNVLCVSGINGATNIIITDVPAYTTSCSIYDPATNLFSAAASVSPGRAAHRATLTAAGDVFVAGGVTGATGTATNETRRYNAVTAPVNTWTAAGTVLPGGAVALQGQVLLKNGAIHVSGGGTGSILAFSATAACAIRSAAGVLAASTSMPDARGFHLAVRLADGSVLISGGGDSAGAALATNWLYTPNHP